MADECPACITSTGYCELHPPPLTLDPALVPYAIAMLKRELMWEMACYAFDSIAGTDVENAVAELAEEDDG